MKVKEVEVTQLKHACINSKFGKDNPKVVYIVNTKCHKLRFFVKDRQDARRIDTNFHN